MGYTAIVDASSGIAGDMMLGALLDLGVEADWLRALPTTLGLGEVDVRIGRVRRGDIDCAKVDFGIPPQPHGRHLKQIVAIVESSAAPDQVKVSATAVFRLLTEAEAAIHGTTVERVHLHEVGAVDAILDVVGTVWGLALLDITDVRCGPIAIGDGHVDAAHGRLAVPAPAVIRLLEGFDLTPGPVGSGELATPTGAALMRALARPGLPSAYRPVRTGFGAGTKDFPGRANAVRVTMADVASARGGIEPIVVLACDVDDMSPEYLAAAATALRDAGARDVALLPSVMKKGRPGTRVEVVCDPAQADALEALMFQRTTTIGVRRMAGTRHVLPRDVRSVVIDGATIRVKISTLPDGGLRAKAEFEDVEQAASLNQARADDIARRAEAAALEG